MLKAVFTHRFLAASHVHRLHFRGASLRVVQVRLRRLWEARFLDRLFLPPEMPDRRDRWTGSPLYSLAQRGAEVIAEAGHLDVADIPHTPSQNRRGFARTRHNLYATDFLVAVVARCDDNDWSAAVTREDRMAGALFAARPVPNAIVPDGAVTLSHPTVPVPQTYLVEIVRAGVKSGNQTIRRRLHRLRAALRSGLFRDVYGFVWVRCVVFLTPTWRRAATLAALARDVPGGDRLFRFGAYEAKPVETSPTQHFPGKTQSPACSHLGIGPAFPVLTPRLMRVPLFDELSITSPTPHV